jgi:hypothetical protein
VTGVAAGSVTFTFTDATTGCSNTTSSVTVKPLPIVNNINDFTYCNKNAGSAISFGSNIVGSTYSWTSDIDVGFGLSGNGNIPGFTAKNISNATVVANINVFAINNGCQGPVKTFKVTVNPSPIITLSPKNQNVCEEVPITPISYSADLNSTISVQELPNNNINGTFTISNGTISSGIISLPNNVKTAQTKQFIIVATSPNGCITKDTATIVVSVPIVNKVMVSNITPACIGTVVLGTQQLSGGAGPGSYTYQWMFSDVNCGNSIGAFTLLTNAQGGNNESIIVTPPASGSRWYRRIVYSGNCAKLSDDCIKVQNPADWASASTSGNSCLNGSSTVTFTASGGTAPITFTYNIITNGVSSGPFTAISKNNSLSATINVPTSVAGSITYQLTTVSDSNVPTSCSVNSSASVCVVVFPNAPTITAPTNTCNAAFALPIVPSVAGFTVQYSIDGGTFATSPSIATTPGCHSIQARYVLTTACGSNAAGSAAPAGCAASNTVSVVVFPTAPVISAPANTCASAFTLPSVTPVAGFNIEYSIDGGAYSASPSTADNCIGYKIKTRYVTDADCGSTVAGTPGSGSCGASPATIRKVDNTQPELSCPTVNPICEVSTGMYTISPLKASDNCTALNKLIITYKITGATTTRPDGTGLDASGAFSVGVSTITWTVVDECGNSNTCQTTVTINTKPTAPTITHN